VSTVCTCGFKMLQECSLCILLKKLLHTLPEILLTRLSWFWKLARSWTLAGCTHTTHEFGSTRQHVFSVPGPPEHSCKLPLQPTTASHPDSKRLPQSAFSFLDSDTVRWPKWIICSESLLGDGVPGTLCIFLFTLNLSLRMKPFPD
jgi:hypothetical protein